MAPLVLPPPALPRPSSGPFTSDCRPSMNLAMALDTPDRGAVMLEATPDSQMAPELTTGSSSSSEGDFGSDVSSDSHPLSHSTPLVRDFIADLTSDFLEALQEDDPQGLQAVDEAAEMAALVELQAAALRKSAEEAAKRRGPRGGSSRFRGVTQHRRTKKWEAHIWDNRKQLYLGGYDVEEHAGVAHDVMAIKCRLHAPINFQLDWFRALVAPIHALSKDTIVYLLRRKGTSIALKARQATAVKKPIRKAKRKAGRPTRPRISQATEITRPAQSPVASTPASSPASPLFTPFSAASAFSAPVTAPAPAPVKADPDMPRTLPSPGDLLTLEPLPSMPSLLEMGSMWQCSPDTGLCESLTGTVMRREQAAAAQQMAVETHQMAMLQPAMAPAAAPQMSSLALQPTHRLAPQPPAAAAAATMSTSTQRLQQLMAGGKGLFVMQPQAPMESAFTLALQRQQSLVKRSSVDGTQAASHINSGSFAPLQPADTSFSAMLDQLFPEVDSALPSMTLSLQEPAAPAAPYGGMWMNSLASIC